MEYALLGGAIIGIAVSLMLVFNGRVTGISGIVSGILSLNKGDLSWRILFVLGLIFGGVVLNFFYPTAFVTTASLKYFDYILAGLLVGFGTLLGNGCTSGHGVCGISRFSIRSIVATLVFILFGIISVVLFKLIRGDL